MLDKCSSTLSGKASR